MSRFGRARRWVLVCGGAAALMAPQWIIAARYRPTDPTSNTSSEFEVAVERGVVDEHVDLPGTFSTEGSAVLTVEGVSSRSQLELRAEAGRAVATGGLLALAERRDEAGTTTARPIFFLACPPGPRTDVEPGGASQLVACLQVALASRGARLSPIEVAEQRLGSTTQAALDDLYRDVGAEAPVTEDDLDVKRLDAEATVVTAAAAAASVLPGDETGRRVARLRWLSAAAVRDRLRDRAGVRLVAGDFLTAPVGEVVSAGVVDGDDTGVGVSVSWGRSVIAVEVPEAVWRSVAGSVEHHLVVGDSHSGLVVASAAPGPDGSQRVLLSAGVAPEDSAAFEGASAGASATVRFVVRTTTTPVVSVPAIAVHHDGSDSSVIVGRGARRRRLIVHEREVIGGRSVLMGSDVLAGIDDVVVG